MAAESGWVLDSSALLALLAGEHGAEAVEACLDRAVVSSVNLGETVTKLVKFGASSEQARSLLQDLKLDVVAWDEPLVWQGQDLCRLAWTHGLSLGDRACLTTARALGRVALTSDSVWLAAARAVRPAVRVELFR